MISIKSEREIELLRHAGNIVYKTHQYLKPYLKEGITTREIDELAANFIKKCGAIPSCKGYEGYPANICISINDEVVHGIAGRRKLKNVHVIRDIMVIQLGVIPLVMCQMMPSIFWSIQKRLYIKVLNKLRLVIMLEIFHMP